MKTKLWIILNDIISNSNSSLWHHFLHAFVHFCQQYDELNGNWKCHRYFEMIDSYVHKIDPLKYYRLPNNLFNTNFKDFIGSRRKLLSELCYSYFNNKIMCSNIDNGIALLLMELIEKNSDSYFFLHFSQFWNTLVTNDHNYKVILQTILPNLLSEEIHKASSTFQPSKRISLKISKKRSNRAIANNDSECSKGNYLFNLIQAVLNHEIFLSFIRQDKLLAGNCRTLADISASKLEVILLLITMAKLSLAQYHSCTDTQNRLCYHWKFQNQQNVVKFIKDNIILCRRLLR